jgi:hypothetical protein
LSLNYTDLNTPQIAIKIQGGTTRSDVNLCRSCKHAFIRRGINNHEKVSCNRDDSHAVPFEVAECNEYHNANQPYLSEMEEIAWRVITKGTRVVGFVDPAGWAKHERAERSR